MQTTDEDRKALEKPADAISWQPSLGQGPRIIPAGDEARGSSVFDTGTSPIVGTEFAGPYGGGMGAGGLDWGKTMGAPYTRAAEPQHGMLGEPVTAPYERYFDVTSPYGKRSGGEVVGQLMNKLVGDPVHTRRTGSEILAVDDQPPKAHWPSFQAL